MEMPRTAKGQAPAAMYATHIVSPEPVETHVFLSLLYRTPFVIGTRDKKVWIISDGTISPLKMDGK